MFQENSLRRLIEIENKLNKEQRNLLQINSMRNFLLFFNKMHDERDKIKIAELIDQYFERIEMFDFIINRQISNELGFSYTLKISPYYKHSFGFKYFNSSPLVPLIQGLLVDLGLTLIRILERIEFLPIATIILFGRWLYVRIFYVPKNRVFGIRY